MSKKTIPGTPGVGPKVIGQGTPPDPFRSNPAIDLGPPRPGQPGLSPGPSGFPPNWQDPTVSPVKPMGAQPGPYTNPNRSYWFGSESGLSIGGPPPLYGNLQPPGAGSLPVGLVDPPIFSEWFLEQALHGLSGNVRFVWNWWRSPIFDFRPDLGAMGNDELNTVQLNRPYGAGFQFVLTVRPDTPINVDGTPEVSAGVETFEGMYSSGSSTGVQRPRCYIWEEASIAQSVDTLYQFAWDVTAGGRVPYGMLPIQNVLTDVTADVYSGSYQSIIKLTPPPSRYYRVNFLIDNGNSLQLPGGLWPVFKVSGAVY